MFRTYVADCKAWLKDRPANIVLIILAGLVIVFLNIWGIITCGCIYCIEYEEEIYQLLPETEKERRRRRIFNASIELILVAMLTTFNLLIMHQYNQSLLLQFPSALLMETGYCMYLFHCRISKICDCQVTTKEERNIYDNIVFIVDKIMLIALVCCGITLVYLPELMYIVKRQIICTVLMTGIGIGFIILLIDVIRQIGGGKYAD